VRNPYKPYVGPQTALDIIYISDAIEALIRLHNADAKLFTPQVVGTTTSCLFPSCSAWPLLGKAGGTIMKRRLIML
jgi:hypothetical protein